MKKYPDIRALIKKKEDHRQLLAALSFEEKIELVFKLKARQKFIRSGRPIGEKRPQARRQPKGYSSIGNLPQKSTVSICHFPIHSCQFRLALR
jgi:hypothetical protein